MNRGAMNIGMRLVGQRELIFALKQLPKNVYARVIAKTNNLCMKPTLAMARSLVPVRYGILKKSLGMITKKYPSKGIIMSIIGARTGFRQTVGMEVKLGAKRGAGGRFESKGTKQLTGTVDPTKYAHLVEFGHGGKHPAQPHPFLRPAWDATSGIALFNYKRILWDGIVREAEKLAAKKAAA